MLSDKMKFVALLGEARERRGAKRRVIETMRLTHTNPISFLSRSLPPLSAASAHDVGHVGVNNNFLVNTNHELAIRYCYEAPLEKMHASKGFEYMRGTDSDVFHIFDGEELKTARLWFMNFILATDMADHFMHISQLTGKIERGVGVEVKDDNEQSQVSMGVK